MQVFRTEGQYRTFRGKTCSRTTLSTTSPTWVGWDRTEDSTRGKQLTAWALTWLLLLSEDLKTDVHKSHMTFVVWGLARTMAVRASGIVTTRCRDKGCGFIQSLPTFQKLVVLVFIQFIIRLLRVKTHIQRGGAERPAACDLIRGKKAVDLFPRMKSQAAGRSAPRRPAPLHCMWSLRYDSVVTYPSDMT